MTSPLTDIYDRGADDLSWDAACEQMALCACMHYHDTDAVDAIVRKCDPRTRIVRFHLRTDAMEGDEKLIPSHVLIQSRGKLFLAINGTETMAMWRSNVAGAFWRRGLGDDANVPAHSYFAWCAEQIAGRIRQDIADAGVSHIDVSGHSLGGATAHLLCCLLKSEGTVATADLVTFGEPRSLGAEYAGKLPDHHYRVVNAEDPVPYVAPGIREQAALNVVFPLSMAYPFKGWAHFGKLQWIDNDGTVNTVPGAEGPIDPPAPELTGYHRAHYAQAYLGALGSVIRSRQGKRSSAAVLAVAVRAYGGSELVETLALPDPDRFVDIGALNAAVSGGADGPYTRDNWRTLTVSSVASTTAAVGPDDSALGGFSGYRGLLPMSTVTVADKWRIVAQLNNAYYGSSHSIVLQGPLNVEDATAAAKQWVNKRACLLGSDKDFLENNSLFSPSPTLGTPVYEYMTVQDALNPRDSAPVMIPWSDGGPYSVAGGNSSADVMSSALSIRLEGIHAGTVPSRSYHVETFVGFPDNALIKGRVNWKCILKSPDFTFRKLMDEYINFITKGTFGFGFMGQDPLIPKQLVRGFAVTPIGELKLTVVGHGYITGDHVRLTGKVGKKYRRVYPVVANDNDTITLVGSHIREEELPRKGYVQRTRTAAGTRDEVFYRFTAPKGRDIDNGYLVKVTKRQLRPKSIPVSFYQKGR